MEAEGNSEIREITELVKKKIKILDTLMLCYIYQVVMPLCSAAIAVIIRCIYL